MEREQLLPVLISVIAGLAAPAAAQTFQNASAQIPSGSPFNDSSTENVDFADVDLDGDYDAVFANGGDDGNDRNRLWINQGGLQGGTIGFYVDDTAARLPNIQDTSRDVDFADFDADGDQDLYVSNTSTQSNQSNRFLINMGGLQGGTAGFFVDESSTRWVNVGVNDGVTTFSSVAPSFAFPSGGFVDCSCDCVFGDLDHDGDLDLVHTSYGGIFSGGAPSRLFLNDGLGNFEEFNPSGYQLSGQNIPNGAPALWAQGTFNHDTSDTSGAEADIADTPVGVEIGDMDGDWDIDILHGAVKEVPRVFHNFLSESGSFIAFRDVTHSAQTQPSNSGGSYEQELGDFDNDNDLDIYGVNWTWSLSNFEDIVSRNDGTGTYGPLIVLAGSEADDNEADWLDYDNDGNLDVFVCRFLGQDKLYRNSGAPDFTFSEPYGGLPISVGISLGADSVDIDNDGDYDLMVCYDNGKANRLFKNTSNVADTTAPRVVLEQVAPASAAELVAIRAQVFDNASWDVQRYNTGVLEYSVDGGPVQSVPLRYMGGQSWRAEIPAGTTGAVSYTAKSIDGSGNTGVSLTLNYSVGVGSVSYCTAGTSAAGCQALISHTGTASATATSGFSLVVGSLEGQKDGLFYFGINGRQANPWGSGTSYQCVLPPVTRCGLLSGVGTKGDCDGSFSQDLNALWCPSCSEPAKNPGAGALVQAQLWYRDPLSTSNQTTSLSDAVEFLLNP